MQLRDWVQPPPLHTQFSHTFTTVDGRELTWAVRGCQVRSNGWKDIGVKLSAESWARDFEVRSLQVSVGHDEASGGTQKRRRCGRIDAPISLHTHRCVGAWRPFTDNGLSIGVGVAGRRGWGADTRAGGAAGADEEGGCGLHVQDEGAPPEPACPADLH